jgi:hypothetical protein
MSKKEIFASGAMPSISPKTPKLFPATEPDTWVPCPSEVGAREWERETARERERERVSEDADKTQGNGTRSDIKFVVTIMIVKILQEYIHGQWVSCDTGYASQIKPLIWYGRNCCSITTDN